jgi:hypothetical protein
MSETRIVHLSARVKECLQELTSEDNISSIKEHVESVESSLKAHGHISSLQKAVDLFTTLGMSMPYVGVIITAFKLLDQLVKEDKQGIMIELWERVMEQNRELQKSVDKLPDKIRQIFREQVIEEAATAVQACRSSLQRDKEFDKNLLADVKRACARLSRLLTDQMVLSGKRFLTELAEDVKYEPAQFAVRVYLVLSIYQQAVDLIRIDAILDPTSKWISLKDLKEICDKATEEEQLGVPYRDVFESVKEAKNDLYILRNNDLVLLENEALPDHVMYVGKNVNDGIFHKPLIGPKLAQGMLTVSLGESIPDDFSEARLKEEQSSAQIKYGDQLALSCPAYRYQAQDVTNNPLKAVAGWLGFRKTKFGHWYSFRFGDPSGQYVGKLKSQNAELLKCGYVYHYPDTHHRQKNKCFFAGTASDATKHGKGKAAMLWEMEPAGTVREKEKGKAIRDGDSVFIGSHQKSAKENRYLTFQTDNEPLKAALVFTSSSQQKYRIRLVRLLSEEEKKKSLYGSEEDFTKFDKAMTELEDLFVQNLAPSGEEIARAIQEQESVLQVVSYPDKSIEITKVRYPPEVNHLL